MVIRCPVLLRPGAGLFAIAQIIGSERPARNPNFIINLLAALSAAGGQRTHGNSRILSASESNLRAMRARAVPDFCSSVVASSAASLDPRFPSPPTPVSL